MKVVIVPDSYKGCASSREICEYMKNGVLSVRPDASVICIPVADGGEGTVEAVLAATDGKKVTALVQGPFGDMVEAAYALTGDTAVIEMASAAGLALSAGRVEEASTYGVGQLIGHALSGGAKKVILGLGGSGTNDAGCGMAVALGARFYDGDGNPFIPTGGTLQNIARMEPCGHFPVDAMCDVDNPLFGKTGAAYVYGPQKGAKDPEKLDAGLRHIAAMIETDPDTAGAGAAGGFGYAVLAFFGGSLKSGIDVVLDLADFENKVAGADLVLTGEGQMDFQTARGKVPVGVARRAKKLSVPVVAVCGAVERGFEAVYSQGITAVFSAVKGPCTLEAAMTNTRENVTSTVADIVRLID